MVTTHPSPQRPTTTAEGRAGFDRRLFVEVIGLLALVGIPVVLVLAALADRPYVLVALALTIPALAAVPVVLEQRHAAGRRRARLGD